MYQIEILTMYCLPDTMARLKWNGAEAAEDLSKSIIGTKKESDSTGGADACRKRVSMEAVVQSRVVYQSWQLRLAQVKTMKHGGDLPFLPKHQTATTLQTARGGAGG